MALAFNNLRRGNKYQLRNHGEVFDFLVIDIAENDVYKLKDLHTLEIYLLHELLQYGKGKDYDLIEL